MSTKKRKKEAWQKSQTLEERRNVRSKISTIRKYVSQNAKEVTDDSDKATQMIGTLNAVFKSDGTRSFFSSNVSIINIPSKNSPPCS